jgi:hypothetical protein
MSMTGTLGGDFAVARPSEMHQRSRHAKAPCDFCHLIARPANCTGCDVPPCISRIDAGQFMCGR